MWKIQPTRSKRITLRPFITTFPRLTFVIIHPHHHCHELLNRAPPPRYTVKFGRTNTPNLWHNTNSTMVSKISGRWPARPSSCHSCEMLQRYFGYIEPKFGHTGLFMHSLHGLPQPAIIPNRQTYQLTSLWTCIGSHAPSSNPTLCEHQLPEISAKGKKPSWCIRYPRPPAVWRLDRFKDRSLPLSHEIFISNLLHPYRISFHSILLLPYTCTHDYLSYRLCIIAQMAGRSVSNTNR